MRSHCPAPQSRQLKFGAFCPFCHHFVWRFSISNRFEFRLFCSKNPSKTVNSFTLFDIFKIQINTFFFFFLFSFFPSSTSKTKKKSKIKINQIYTQNTRATSSDSYPCVSNELCDFSSTNTTENTNDNLVPETADDRKICVYVCVHRRFG